MLPYGMIAGGTFTITLNTPVEVSCVSQNPPDFIIAQSISGWGEANDAQGMNGGGKDRWHKD